MKYKSYISKKELKEKKAQEKKNKKNFIAEFFDEIDLSKKFPKYVNKKIFRTGFLFVAIIQLIALTMTGFNFNPAWAECNKDLCKNPFYMATGEVCEQNVPLCSQATLTKGEVLGTKPPKFALMANDLSFACLIIAGFVNHYLYKKRRAK